MRAYSIYLLFITVVSFWNPAIMEVEQQKKVACLLPLVSAKWAIDFNYGPLLS
jgi:hypothetical protein